MSFRNEDWWYAKHTDPKYTNQKQEGYVPRNYVALEDTLDTQELDPFSLAVVLYKTH